MYRQSRDTVRKEKGGQLKDDDDVQFDMFTEHLDLDSDGDCGGFRKQKNEKSEKGKEKIDDGSCKQRPSGFDWTGVGFKSIGLLVNESDGDERFVNVKEGVKRQCEREEGKFGRFGKMPRVETKELNSNGLEKHTKGIGMKLLEKMGYGGGGLGKNEQGIVDPIEVKLRPKAMGMGYGDYKELNLPKVREVNENELFFVASGESGIKGKSLSKQARLKKKRRKFVRRKELWARKEDRILERKVVEKVFDMRRPEVCVWTDLKNLNAKKNKSQIDECIKEVDQEKHLEDLEEMDQEKHLEDLEEMEEMVSILDRIEVENSSGTLTLTSLANTFKDLQTRFAGHSKFHSFIGIACSFAKPLFIEYFQGWNPLQIPPYGVEIVSLWKTLLQADLSDTGSLYTQIIVEAVLPAIRLFGINTWQAREPQPMIFFMEFWEDLLPVCVRDSIVDNVVMPKLSAAVNSWDPLRETIPIHLWVHPWLPCLHQQSDIICQTICQRFGGALQAWHPSDVSAYHMLLPWKTAFKPASWDRLMVRYIKPKLLTILHAFQVDPANKNHLEWVLTWTSVFPLNHMLNLMDAFFDKWQAVLYHLLCEGPNFEELISWFLYWKNLIPPELLANDHIQFRLRMGLNMMDKAAEGRKVVQLVAGDNFSYCRLDKQRQFEATRNEKMAHQRDDGDNWMSLKQIIELQALQNGLIFKPKPGRRHNGHQIYGFGTINIIIDSFNERLSAQIGDKWSLLSSFDQLLKLQNGSDQKQN